MIVASRSTPRRAALRILLLDGYPDRGVRKRAIRLRAPLFPASAASRETSRGGGRSTCLTSNIPTEVVRSWVGQDVTAFAHSAGVPDTLSISTPEVPRGTRRLRRPGVTQEPPWPHWARGNRGRYCVTLGDLSGSLNDTERHKQLREHHHLRGRFRRLLPLARRLRIVLAP